MTNPDNLELIKQDISKRLVQLRKMAGYPSAASFAKHAGLSVSKYTHYEQGHANISLQTAMLLAQALGVTLAELAYGEEPSHAENSRSLCERADRLSEEGYRELLDALGYIEFKENRRKISV